jgi:hypothetical protein
MEDCRICSRCHRKASLSEFFRNGKYWKTCNNHAIGDQKEKQKQYVKNYQNKIKQLCPSNDFEKSLMGSTPAEKKQQKMSLNKIQAISNIANIAPEKQEKVVVQTKPKTKPSKPKSKESTIKKHQEYISKFQPKPKEEPVKKIPTTQHKKVDKRSFRLNWRREHGLKLSDKDPQELKDILSQL